MRPVHHTRHWLLRTVLSLLLVLCGTMLVGCSALVRTVKNRTCELDPRRPYDVVEVDPAFHEIRLYWKRPDGSLFTTLEDVQIWIDAQGDSLVAATNAGIYEPGYVPTGLFIEDGVVKQPLNLDDGYGNFFLKPNGVFLITETGRGRIVESSEFSSVEEPVRYATQSGPLLVIDGKLHPAFTPASDNCRLRSGVGVRDDGTVFLAISRGAVSFYDFAVFFRDKLQCPNALYLDGGISELYAPSLGRTDTGGSFAGILAVVLKEPALP